MTTKHSIELETATAPCYAVIGTQGQCSVLTRIHPECGTSLCPFYKPRGCKDWIRVEDYDGLSLIPPEEYYNRRRPEPGTENVRFWKIVSVKA